MIQRYLELGRGTPVGPDDRTWLVDLDTGQVLALTDQQIHERAAEDGTEVLPVLPNDPTARSNDDE